MEFSEAVIKRRMVRNFTEQPVEPTTIKRLLGYARQGPSAGFTQGQDFVVVSDPESIKTIAHICGEEGYISVGFDPFISRAPLLIIPCTNEAAYHRRYREPDKLGADETEMEWPIPYWYMDVGCAVMLLLLGVVDEGLAAGFVGVWDLDALREHLSIPSEIMPMGVIPIGHPAPDKRSPSLKRGRRSEDEVVHQEIW